MLWAVLRHGIGIVAARLGLGRLVLGRWKGSAPPGASAASSPAAHIRMALEDLGTAAIKVGQLLSTRPDLVSPRLIVELEKLRTQVPPVPGATILSVVERELGQPVSAVFREFHPEPLAAASIGQVHAATLLDGTPVAVKVRKPGVIEEVEIDLSVLARLAHRVGPLLARSGVDVEAVTAEFAATLRAELDYTREGTNADELRRVLASDTRCVIPRIHWEATTAAMLVMERLHGIPITDVAALDAAGISRPALAQASAELLMTQALKAGMFHADPHPGNFLVLFDGRIGLLDFGMVGRLETPVRLAFLRFVLTSVSRDAGGMTEALEALGILPRPQARAAVEQDMAVMLQRYHGLSADEFSLSAPIHDMFLVAHRHRLRLPSDLVLLLKTLTMAEGLWRQLDPRFNLTTMAAQYLMLGG